jgi:hypothetical protein
MSDGGLTVGRISFNDQYNDHLCTWEPHGRAPRAVYKGQLDVLIQAAVDAEREECAKVVDKYAPISLRELSALIRARDGV